MEISRSPFATTRSGEAVDEFAVSNSHGVSFKLITYGATLTSVKVPDADGRIDEITIGFDRLEDYEGEHPFFGATIGRYANRIAHGRFTIDDQSYDLEKNNHGIHHLHGGSGGFHRRLWEAFPVKKAEEAGVTLSLESPHMDQGYPGTLAVKLGIMLSEANELSFTYEAAGDRATPVSLTNHTYWNLGGECSGPIDDHLIRINSREYLEVDETLLPTGNIIPAADSAFDFRIPTSMGAGIKQTGGYDHCYTLSTENALSIPAAEVFHPGSRRSMTVFTISPGLQFYTGNFLKNNRSRCGELNAHEAFCLETEEYPDAMNHPNFPDVILRPNQHYFRKTVYQFGLKT